MINDSTPFLAFELSNESLKFYQLQGEISKTSVTYLVPIVINDSIPEPDSAIVPYQRWIPGFPTKIEMVARIELFGVKDEDVKKAIDPARLILFVRDFLEYYFGEVVISEKFL